jgi:hypothetical protein
LVDLKILYIFALGRLGEMKKKILYKIVIKFGYIVINY